MGALRGVEAPEEGTLFEKYHLGPPVNGQILTQFFAAGPLIGCVLRRGTRGGPGGGSGGDMVGRVVRGGVALSRVPARIHGRAGRMSTRHFGDGSLWGCATGRSGI